MIKGFLLLFLASLSLPAFSAEVPRDEWANAVRSALPTKFCQPKHYYRQCFRVTAQECKGVAASATRTCLTKIKNDIPAIFTQPRDGTVWNSVLITCVTRAYESAFMQKHIDSKICNDPNNWL